MRLKPIDEQVVVVFGASSGIGRETALQFGRRGARVVVAARDREGLESLADEIRQEGGQAVVAQADAADFEQVKAVADSAVNAFGHLDTWVHVASVTQYARFDQTTPDEFRRIVDVNLTGAAHGAMAALPHLKAEGRGALILVSSVEGKYALPLQSAYSASKHGVEGLAKSLRLELERDGIPISVTTILPSSMNTPLFDVARTKLGVKPQGFPPVYRPQLAAEAILHAATHPEREIVVGGAGKALEVLNRISPRLADAAVARKAFWLQRSAEERPADTPGNLYEPVPGHYQVEGSYPGRTMPFSLYTWLRLRPGLRYGLSALALSGLAFAVIGPATVLTGVRSLAATAMAALPFRRRRLRRGLVGRAGAVLEDVRRTAGAAPGALADTLAQVAPRRFMRREVHRGPLQRARDAVLDAWCALQGLILNLRAGLPSWMMIGPLAERRVSQVSMEQPRARLEGYLQRLRSAIPISLISLAPMAVMSMLGGRRRRR